MIVKNKYSEYVIYVRLPKYVGQFLRNAYHANYDKDGCGVIFIPDDYIFGEVASRYRLENIHEMVRDTLFYNLVTSGIRTEPAMAYSELSWRELPDEQKDTDNFFAFALPKEVFNRRVHTFTVASPTYTLHSEWVSIFRTWCSNFFWQHLKMYVMRHQDAGTIPRLQGCITAFMTCYGIDETNRTALIKNYSRQVRLADRFTDKLMSSVDNPKWSCEKISK